MKKTKKKWDKRKEGFSFNEDVTVLGVHVSQLWTRRNSVLFITFFFPHDAPHEDILLS